MDQVVVVGGGLAGLRACEGLREHGYEGRLFLAGEEEHLPYDRPPLSKQFLAGEWGFDRVVLRDEARLAGLGLDRLAGPAWRATGLDLSRRRVRFASGEELFFDGLVVATGSRARLLPGLEGLANTHLLRTLEDSRALSGALFGGGRLLVVGAGFIGMEVAATARRLGAEVAVVEPLSTPLGRVLGPLAGEACARLHREHGVRLLLGRSVASVEEVGKNKAVVLVLDDGSRLEGDCLLVAVGAVPNVSWLEGSGLEVGAEGVACDASLLAAPGVVVAGDVALWPHGRRGTATRLEHRTNAAEQGEHAARSLLGERVAFETVPYVWTDQYDAKIQLLGLPQPTDECVVVEGEPDSGRFVALYGREGLLSGAVGFSMPRALMRWRAALEAETPFREALAAAS